MSVSRENKENIGERDGTRDSLFKRVDELVQDEEQSTIVEENTLGNATIVGSSTNGIVGTNTGTVGGGQQVVGGSGRVLSVVRVVNPDNIYRDRFVDDEFEDSGNTTATGWGTGTLSFTADQVATSTPVYKNNRNISSVIGTTDADENVLLECSTDGSTYTIVGKSFGNPGGSIPTPFASYPFNGDADEIVKNTSTSVVGATLTTDRFGNLNSAYSFNGSSDYIDTGVQGTYTSGFTVSAWVKTSTSAVNNIFFGSFNEAGTTDPFISLFKNSAGKAVLQVRGFSSTINTVTSTTSIDDGEWYHVVGTLNSGLFTISVNGTQEDSTTAVLGTGLTVDDNFYIGAFNNDGTDTNHFDGDIDNVIFWDEGLSSSQIGFLYNGGARNEFVIDGTDSASLAAGNELYWRVTAGQATSISLVKLSYE